MKVGFINDLYRSLKQQPFLLMECTPSAVNWHNVNKAKRPGMNLLSSMQMIAHGSDSVLYFQYRKSRGSSEKLHGAVVDHDNSPKNRVFQEVAKVGETLERLSEVVGTKRPAQTAILYDWEIIGRSRMLRGLRRRQNVIRKCFSSITAHSGNTISLSTSSRKNKTFHHINC